MMVNGSKTKTSNKYAMGINLFFNEYSAIISASLSGMARRTGIPYIIKIPKILNNKWLIAAMSAETVPVRAAKSAVTVVPILAPSVNGKICLNVKTPAPARGTTKDVVMEELWTIMVSAIPNAMARKTVLKMY